MTETKVRHPGTGKAADVAEMVITDAEGRGKEVLALNLGSRPIYRKNWEVALALVGCTAETSGNAQWLQPWSCVIEPLAGHQQLPWNTKVTMGGVDITADVYDKATGAVSIPSVTGDIAIEAEAVVITGGYQPIEWIKKLVHGRYFDLGYAANVHTEIELDITIPNRANQCVISQTGASASSVGTYEPAFVFRALSTSNPPRFGTMKLGNDGWSGSNHPTPPKDERLIVRMGDLKASYRYPNGTLISSNTWDADTVFEGEVASNIWLFASPSTANGGFFGEIYRARHYESGVLVHDYIPVKSGEEYGLYEIKTGEALLKADTVVTGSDVANTANSLQSTNEEEM